MKRTNFEETLVLFFGVSSQKKEESFCSQIVSEASGVQFFFFLGNFCEEDAEFK